MTWPALGVSIAEINARYRRNQLAMQAEQARRAAEYHQATRISFGTSVQRLDHMIAVRRHGSAPLGAHRAYEAKHADPRGRISLGARPGRQDYSPRHGAR